jgi:plastocyanin
MRVRSLLLAAGATAAVACSDSGNGGQEPADEVPEGDIQVRNDLFDPADLEVAPGASVIWAWASNGTVHNILFDDGPTSGNKGSGTYERTFAAAGDFPYHCTVHPATMSGTISVVAAPSPGGGSGGGGDDDPYDPGDPGY